MWIRSCIGWLTCSWFGAPSLYIDDIINVYIDVNCCCCCCCCLLPGDLTYSQRYNINKLNPRPLLEPKTKEWIIETDRGGLALRRSDTVEEYMRYFMATIIIIILWSCAYIVVVGFLGQNHNHVNILIIIKNKRVVGETQDTGSVSPWAAAAVDNLKGSQE